MKVNPKILSKDQLLTLLHKTNQKLDSYSIRYKNTYHLLLGELKRRRELHVDQLPEVIRRDPSNQFGIINRDYFNRLNHIDQTIYINWKWDEL